MSTELLTSVEKPMVVLITGPLGVGKTSTLNRILPNFEGSTVIINDVGQTNVDASRLNSSKNNVIPLTAGCMGCDDMPSFLNAYEKAQDSQNVVFVEPTGTALGQEMIRALQVINSPYAVLGLVSARHFREDDTLGIVQTQLAIADIVGVTKWEGVYPGLRSLVDPRAEELIDYVGQHSRNAQIHLIPKEGLFPTKTLKSLLEIGASRGSARLFNVALSIGQLTDDHDHSDHDDHESTHGIHTITVDTSKRDTAWLDSTVEELSRFGLVRAKGRLPGFDFDVVHSDLSISPSDQTPQSNVRANFITTQKVPDDVALTLKGEIEVEQEALTRGKILAQGKFDETARQMIEQLLLQYPPVVSEAGEVRTSCDADQAVYLADREGAPQEIIQKAYSRFIEWRVNAVTALVTSEILQAHADSPKWGLVLGLNLAWYRANMPERFSTDLQERIDQINPHQILIDSLLKVSSLNFQYKVGEESPESIGGVIEAGLKRQIVSKDQALLAVEHCRELSQVNPDFAARWQAAVEKIQALEVPE